MSFEFSPNYYVKHNTGRAPHVPLGPAWIPCPAEARPGCGNLPGLGSHVGDLCPEQRSAAARHQISQHVYIKVCRSRAARIARTCVLHAVMRSH